jgi:hypothetical protein
MTESSPGCVFCGGKPLSREHVVPVWAKRLVAVEGPLATTRDVLGSEGRFRDGWTPRALELVVRKICTACNNGWMADLERRIAPLMGPMIASPFASGRLRARDIDLISAWITKTVLVSDLVTRVDGIEVIQPWEYHWFYEHQLRFPDSAGWLAAYDFDGHSPFSISVTDQGPIGSGAFRAVGNLGALAFMIRVVPFGPPPSPDRIQLPKEVRPLVVRLYPRRRRTLSWPPRKILKPHDLHLVAGIEHSVWNDWQEGASGLG